MKLTENVTLSGEMRTPTTIRLRKLYQWICYGAVDRL